MKYQGQRNLAGSSPWGPQSQTRLSDGTTINHAYMYEYLEWKQRMQKCELRKQNEFTNDQAVFITEGYLLCARH